MTIWLGWMCILPSAWTQIQDIIWHTQPYHQYIDKNTSAELSFSLISDLTIKDLHNFKSYFDLELILFQEDISNYTHYSPELINIFENSLHFSCRIPFEDLKRGRTYIDLKVISKENGTSWHLHDFADPLPTLNTGSIGFRNAALHYAVNDNYTHDYALLQNGLVLADFPDQLGGIFTNGFCKDEVISLRDLMIQIWTADIAIDPEVQFHLFDEESQSDISYPLRFVADGNEGEWLNPYFKEEYTLTVPGLTEKLYQLEIISEDLLATFSNSPGEHELSFYLSLSNGEEEIRLPENGNFVTRFTIANAPVGADCQAALLPIELLDFLVLSQEDQVYLKWISALEINNQFYAIERSRDVINWETIYEVHGQGNSNDYISYSYTDLQPIPGISYYRLRQMDFDGSQTYSKVKTVRIKSSSLQLHPNPVRDFLYYKIEDPNQYYKVKVYDVQGACLFETLIPDPASQYHRIDLNSLPNGCYILKYINQDNYLSKTSRFVKL